MFCRECGKELPDNSTFCGYCGATQTPSSNETNPVDATDMQTCPYCMSSIRKAAIICPNCRKRLKKNKKPFYIAGIAVAAVAIFFIASSVASMLDPTSSIESAYDKLFADLGNGSFHAEDGEYSYSAQKIVNDCTYLAASDGYYNRYNSFKSISNSDVTRIWNVSMKNYDYNVKSVVKDGEKYEVVVELRNKDIYSILDTAFSDYESQFDLSGVGWGDALGAIVGAREGYINSGGGLFGALGALVGAQEATNAANADIDAYKAGMDNGSNAKQVVDLFEQYVESNNYGMTNTETIRFYATKDKNGNWCIPDLIYVETPAGSFEELSQSEIFYGMLGYEY